MVTGNVYRKFREVLTWFLRYVSRETDRLIARLNTPIPDAKYLLGDFTLYGCPME